MDMEKLFKTAVIWEFLDPNSEIYKVTGDLFPILDNYEVKKVKRGGNVIYQGEKYKVVEIKL